MSLYRSAIIKQHKLHTPEVWRMLELTSIHLEAKRRSLLDRKRENQEKFRTGVLEPEKATEHVRNKNWLIEPLGQDLLDQRTCLLGSAAREDMISGLNSTAKTYIADLWNLTPQKPKILYRAHWNLYRAVRKELTVLDHEAGKHRVGDDSTARLCVVPRPMHVTEESVIVNEIPIAATIYDIVVHTVLNGKRLVEEQGSILFALRGLCCHFEARWYCVLFELMETELGLQRGTIKAMPFIDSISSALELDEIIFELRAHISAISADVQAFALNHIRLYSSIESQVMPDRELVGLDAPFLRALLTHLLGVAHRRGVLAIFPAGNFLHPSELTVPTEGYTGMIAEIKQGIHDGFDGAIVCSDIALPEVESVVRFILPEPNQIGKSVNSMVKASTMIEMPEGDLTTQSLIQMVRTALRYRMAERLDKPWAVQGGRKHDRSSMGLAIGLLSQWNNSEHGVITQSGLPVDEQLLRYLITKEAAKMFSSDEELLREANVQAEHIIQLVLSDPTLDRSIV